MKFASETGMDVFLINESPFKLHSNSFNCVISASGKVYLIVYLYLTAPPPVTTSFIISNILIFSFNQVKQSRKLSKVQR
jgi:hypothetical protein